MFVYVSMREVKAAFIFDETYLVSVNLVTLDTKDYLDEGSLKNRDINP